MNPKARELKLRAVLVGAALLIGLTATSAAAQEAQNSGAPGDWLSRFQSSRSLGMGGAFAATADDPLGAIWNPAGLTRLYRNEFRMETARLFEGTSTNAIALALPGNRYASFGVSMISLGSDDFERTNELNNPQGSFGVGETAVFLTGARNLSRNLALGMNFKVVSQDVEEFGGTGFGTDLGLFYSPHPSVNLGVSLLNLGGPVMRLRDTDETYPTELRGGASLAMMNGRGLVSLEVDHRSGRGASAHAGAEFWALPALALRVGYHDDRPVGGFAYRIRHDLQLDYAAADHELGLTHRLGLVYRFGGYAASSVAEPEVFSPTGSTPVTTIKLRARTKAEAQNWALDIQDKSGVVVRRFGGPGGPPAHVPWDGKNEIGLPLPDGVYRFQIRVLDLEGHFFEGPEQVVEILTAGPQGSVPVVFD